MRYQMWKLGIDPLVIPNGLTEEAFRLPTHAALRDFRRRLKGRVVLTKIARWDPDKRWLLAVDTVAELKRLAAHPLLVARGGQEAHGSEVLARAATLGLRVTHRALPLPGAAGLLDALEGLEEADLLILDTPLDGDASRLLLRGSAAVLANSGHEPFGLVGLEAMAVGGLACTGGTGEDYVIPGWNALVLQKMDPHDFVSQFHWLLSDHVRERFLRRNGMTTARRYAWSEIVRRNLLPQVGLPSGPSAPEGLRLGLAGRAARPDAMLARSWQPATGRGRTRQV
jgi:glycosyltransferase involved in cell wall biosynthesis